MSTAPRPGSRRRQESGATLVEYALLVAVLALATIASITALQDTAQAKFDTTAEHIGTRRSEVITSPPSSGDGGGVAVAPTTVPATPATTTSTTTTSTTTTSTTTTSTTTTLPAATVVRSTWGEPVITRNGNQWSAEVSLSIRDDNDSPVSGATVRMVIEYRSGSGQWTPLIAPFDAVTSASGGLVVTSPDVTRSGNGSVSELRFSVTGVTASGLTWNPQGSQVVAGRP